MAQDRPTDTAPAPTPSGAGRLRRAVSAAIADAALASLATLVVGIYAARHLTLAELGGYGLLFLAAFMLGSSTVTQLYFTPIEVDYLKLRPGDQLGALGRSARTGAIIAGGIGVVSVGVALLAIADLDWDTRWHLAVGAAGVATLSPAQDHARRVLHQTVNSTAATAVSAVQLAGVAIALGALHATGMARAVVPLLALSIANALSLMVAVAAAKRLAQGSSTAPPRPRSVLRRGGLLTAATQAEQVAGFVGAALLGQIAGAVALGQIEAARQLSQPLFVLSTGLASVLRPKVMVAAQSGDRAAVRRPVTLYVALLGGAGLLYATVAGLRWPGNPLPDLVPNAYARTGLLAALIVATSAAFTSPMLAAQVVAAQREVSLVRIGLTNTVVYVGVVALASGWAGAFAVPLASFANTAVWTLRVRPVLGAIYARTSCPNDHPLTPQQV